MLTTRRSSRTPGGPVRRVEVRLGVHGLPGPRSEAPAPPRTTSSSSASRRCERLTRLPRSTCAIPPRPTRRRTSIIIPISTAYPVRNGIEHSRSRRAATSPASGWPNAGQLRVEDRQQRLGGQLGDAAGVVHHRAVGRGERPVVRGLHEPHLLIAQQRAEHPVYEVRAEAGAVRIGVHHDVPARDRQRAPHRVALAEHRPHLGSSSDSSCTSAPCRRAMSAVPSREPASTTTTWSTIGARRRSASTSLEDRADRAGHLTARQHQ